MTQTEKIEVGLIGFVLVVGLPAIILATRLAS